MEPWDAKAIAERYGLNFHTGPITRNLGIAELAQVRAVVVELWKMVRPKTPHESDFIKTIGCHQNTFTEGEVNISKKGIEIILYGTAPDQQWASFTLNIPHDGNMTMSSDVRPPA